MDFELKIHNNLTRKKEKFITKEKNKVKFYSCGPTTYDLLHVGNARALIVGDLFNRVFKIFGYDVEFVRNFTDVDDKIIKAALEHNEDPIKYADKYVQECLKDMDELEMIPPSYMPKVSETIPEIIQMISDIIENGYGYEINGEVFFDVRKYSAYGQLSKKDLDSLEHGIRVSVDENKRSPADFVLWKPAKEKEPSWDSPWGKGRPGWHIECSAMAKKFLGDTIDIHHGGIDLMFPHHENEIAQSEAANSVKFCNCWAHNEFLNFGHEKMSKSLGNVVTMRKFIETYGGQVLRHILISAHYRTKLEWSQEAIDKSINEVEKIHTFVVDVSEASPREDAKLSEDILNAIDNMKKELAFDFNTAGAIAFFYTFMRDVRRDLLKDNTLPQNAMMVIFETVKFARDSMGIINRKPRKVLAEIATFRSANKKISESEILKLIEERKLARSEKNFKRSDEIRDFLKEKGVVLKDNPDGSTNYRFE